MKSLHLILISVIALPSAILAQRIIELPVVLQLENMEDVVTQSHVFKGNDSTALRMDISYPPAFDKKSMLPVVILNNGVGSPSLPDWRVYKDWAKLFAVSGMIAINYQANGPVENAMQDARDLIDYIRKNAPSLYVDAGRMGLWTCSGNTQVGVPLVMQPERDYIRCAAIYYGMPDTVRSLRPELSVQVVRAGLDLYQLNRNIDNFVAQALAADLDLEMLNFVEGRHAFDILDDNDRSREIVRRTLDFFERNLLQNGDQQKQEFVLTANRFYTMMRNGQTEEAAKLFRKAAGEHKDESFYRVTGEFGTNGIGSQLLEDGKIEQAIAVFKLVIETYPDRAEAYQKLAHAYELSNQKQLAVENYEKSLELNPEDQSVLEKLNQLRQN